VVSPKQWDKVENVNQVLAVFNDMINVISRSDYPTSNQFLLEMWRMKEILGIKTVDRNEYIRSMIAKMSEKFDKYWGECNMLMYLAIVLDLGYKIKLISFCFLIIYPFDAAGDRITGVLDILKELYKVYVAVHNSSIIQQQTAAKVNASTSIASVTEVVPKFVVCRSWFMQHIRSSDIIRPIKTDFDIYLEEDVFISDSENGEDTNANFDVLGWWKYNALKYRILSKMAQDILAIPIITIALESSFSAGGRIVKPYRASLSTKTI
jgi:hypothetical protein